MNKLYISVPLIFIIVIALLMGACAAPESTPAAPASQPTSQLTVGQLAEQGKTVLANYGQCHGDSGQGLRAPAIIGPNAQLAKYNNAKELLGYISSTMPADKPGSLTQQQYLQVLCLCSFRTNLLPLIPLLTRPS